MKGFKSIILVIMLITGFVALGRTSFVFAQTGFNISSQQTLTVGEPINLVGQLCPNPSNAFQFVVIVNYTGPSGQSVSKSENIGYGSVSLCSSPFVIDSTTYFNITGSWQVQAQAQWTDTNDVYHTVNSNIFNFTVIAQSTTSVTSTSTSSQSSSYTSTSTASTSVTNTTTAQTTASTSTCAFISVTCERNFVSTSNSVSENVTLNQNSEASIKLNITAPSYLGYFAVSKPGQVEEGILSPDQFFYFTQYTQAVSLCNGSAASYSSSCGNSLLNGLLILPGSYYLVVYSPQTTTEVYFGYNSSLELSVVNSTTYVGAFINLSSHSHADFTIHPITLGSPSTLKLFGISTQPVSYEIVNDLSKRSVVLQTHDLTTTNLNGTMPASIVQPFYFISLQPGLYDLFINNTQSSQSEVYFEYEIIPSFVNPYYIIIAGRTGYFSPSPSEPMGVASYGLYNKSNTITPYSQPIVTQSVAGATSINMMKVSSDTVSTPPYDATNQLNAILVVTNKDRTTYVYWPQNVMKFDTKDSVLLFADDIFNLTADGAYLTNATVTSSNGGFVSRGGSYEIFNNIQYYLNGYKQYTLPLVYTLTMTEAVIPGSGVVINMSDYILKGMAQTGSITFDTILIHDQNIQNAYFFVSGSDYTPAGLNGMHVFYDVENIFGGGGGGSEVTFSSFDATVNVAYMAQGSANYTLFPSAYSFGGDTAETAAGVHATYKGNGAVELGLGNENWEYIYPTQSTGPGAYSSQTSTAMPSSSFPWSEIGIIVAVVAAAAVAGLFVFMRKRRTPPPPPA